MPPETVVVTTGAVEEPASVETTAVETASDAAVEIAQIEADRDVRIAEINAETTETIVEAQAEAGVEELEDDVEWLETRLGALEAAVFERLETMQTQHGQMLTLLETILSRLPSVQTPPSETSQQQTQTPTNPDQPVVADGPRENGGAAAAARKRRYLE